jgi:hypothetical protein
MVDLIGSPCCKRFGLGGVGVPNRLVFWASAGFPNDPNKDNVGSGEHGQFFQISDIFLCRLQVPQQLIISISYFLFPAL